MVCCDVFEMLVGNSDRSLFMLLVNVSDCVTSVAFVQDAAYQCASFLLLIFKLLVNVQH